MRKTAVIGVAACTVLLGGGLLVPYLTGGQVVLGRAARFSLIGLMCIGLLGELYLVGVSLRDWVQGLWSKQSSKQAEPSQSYVQHASHIALTETLAVHPEERLVIDTVPVGEGRFVVDLSMHGWGAEERGSQTRRAARSEEEQDSGSSAVGESATEQFACPQAHLGCDFVGKSKKAVGAHQRFCDYREDVK